MLSREKCKKNLKWKSFTFDRTHQPTTSKLNCCSGKLCKANWLNGQRDGEQLLLARGEKGEGAKRSGKFQSWPSASPPIWDMCWIQLIIFTLWHLIFHERASSPPFPSPFIWEMWWIQLTFDNQPKNHCPWSKNYKYDVCSSTHCWPMVSDHIMSIIYLW